ncbi:MAG: MoaD/ThiS family protein [Candidatus Aenigmatarchaeota archaeon]|nr:MAG: MoaD/ThiS family protein [Candidatus Aenigmarchaeota archaeon]
MFVKVLFQKKETEVEVPANAKVADALKAAGISVQTVIPRRNGSVITDEDSVKEGDVIDALRIVSGG